MNYYLVYEPGNPKSIGYIKSKNVVYAKKLFTKSTGKEFGEFSFRANMFKPSEDSGIPLIAEQVIRERTESNPKGAGRKARPNMERITVTLKIDTKLAAYIKTKPNKARYFSDLAKKDFDQVNLVFD